ncbi:MAG: hypothetical protein QGG63_00735 [Candidatus Pacebacteria bacterium]|nr:hypothetical protein [Candidatus Paceibacterota bacterium]
MVLYIVGIIVALVGILGFFSDPVIGILATNAVQSVVYIILGLLLIMSVKKGQTMLAKIVGIILAAIGILGFILSGDMIFGILQSTTAVDLFNLIAGILVLLIGFMNKGGPASTGGGMNNPQMPPQVQ